jgi:hypothetical protein
MGAPTRASEQWASLVEALEAFIRGESSVVEVSRRVIQIRAQLHEDENALFYPFVNVDDDSLTFPIGDVRGNWSDGALAKADAERKALEEFHRNDITAATWALLRYAKDRHAA